ncbi:MAG: hypothetical protein PVI26_12910 [Chitinispirillia bacterium]|jgi:hypothetical protein
MISKKNVFKIKTGYNPNSSSIGTEISMFLKGTVVFSFFVNFILLCVDNFKKNRKPKQEKNDK